MSETGAVDYERLPLAQLPTPLEAAPRLSQAWGGPTILIKRDDLTGFGVSGNKVRKLELHCAAAQAAGASTLITCGAVQSNHCRATAIVAARLGLRCVLFLRSRDGRPPAEVRGNHLLQRLAGAEVRFITPDEWDDRATVMEDAAAELADAGETGWVMPAGASDRLGMAAFELAYDELAGQVTDLVDEPVTVWHASSSGGTTAGLALGAAHRRDVLDATIVGSSVGEPSHEIVDKVRELLAESDRSNAADSPFEIIDDYVGLGYGKTTRAELAAQVEASRLTGLIWDPTYTGKALFALKQEIDAGRFGPDDHVVFWHTGGGFAAFAHDFGDVLDF